MSHPERLLLRRVAMTLTREERCRLLLEKLGVADFNTHVEDAEALLGPEAAAQALLTTAPAVPTAPGTKVAASASTRAAASPSRVRLCSATAPRSSQCDWHS